eukprot:9682947-Alexandrium_andersonii.AAC.1
MRELAATLLGRSRGGFPRGRCSLPRSGLPWSASGVVAVLWGPPAYIVRPFATLPVCDLYLEDRRSALPGSVEGR